MQKRWSIEPDHSQEEVQLAAELKVSPIVAKLLINRGLGDPHKARQFLAADMESLLSPWDLKGMREAVACVTKIMEEGGSIVVYGDYDVDGITATSVVYRFLKRCGASVSYYIPERQSEGYGLNLEALEGLIAKGADLVITVDCGISSYDIVEAVRDRLALVITDHHEAPALIPRAVAVVDHKQPNCPYPDKNLAGVGVAYKLCQAIWQERTGEVYQADLDIVALGTVADVVPLVGENRILVKAGLSKMQLQPNRGMEALIDVAGLKDRKITAGHIGYTLAPRLNAAGRVAHATRAVELLTTPSQEEAYEIAEGLQETNLERQALERDIHEMARQDVLKQGPDADYVVVVGGQDWHPGVIGIVASRLVEEFYKPTLVISIKDGIGKGSCRSIDNCNIYEALQSAEDLLIQFGGHQAAAGFSIKEDKIPALRERLAQYCKEHLAETDYLPIVDIDSQVAIDDIDVPLIEEIETLEPYGMANPTPVLALEEATISDLFLMGQQKKHAKVLLEREDSTIDAIAWNRPDLHASFFPGDRVKVAFTVQKNEWNGHVSPQLMIQDMALLEGRSLILTKEGLRAMYTYVRNLIKGGSMPKFRLETELIRRRPEGQTVPVAMASLEVFKELNLLVEETTEEGLESYRWQPAQGQLHLETSITFMKYSA
ncbi:MAG: single-stranded-DNA-specific exonuclease RecJ [Veillonella sp.]|nr:single-stranded-DNA-specific exonuclease RecJ [Veillonella sp.]